jgi:hypothetical protein
VINLDANILISFSILSVNKTVKNIFDTSSRWPNAVENTRHISASIIVLKTALSYNLVNTHREIRALKSHLIIPTSNSRRCLIYFRKALIWEATLWKK